MGVHVVGVFGPETGLRLFVGGGEGGGGGGGGLWPGAGVCVCVCGPPAPHKREG